MLTDDELRALEMCADLSNLVVTSVIGRSEHRDHDVDEFIFHIHAIQRMIAANSAARQYPQRFRLLGRKLGDIDRPDVRDGGVMHRPRR